MSATNIAESVFLEIFCGTAGVSASLKRAGTGSCISLDKLVPKGTKAQVTKIDLTSHENQRLVLSWLERPEVIGVFAAPPCGTATAARQIQLEPYQHGPPPLRSVDMPDGLNDLTGDALIRVSFANMLYSFVAEVMDRCSELGKPCAIENPRNSLFWLTTPMVERKHTHLDCVQDHQACAYGSKRDKWTRLLANFVEIHQICLTCPKNHVHEPWGRVQFGAKRVFATSLEVHYPTGLCDAIAKAFCTHWASRGLQLSPYLPFNAFAQASSGRQPCGNKLPPLIPDF